VPSFRIADHQKRNNSTPIVYHFALTGRLPNHRYESATKLLSSGGVTVALDRLEKASYVRRKPNPADRRSLLVTVIPARLRKLAGMYEGVERETRRLLATLPQSDLEAVIRFFDALGVARTDSGAVLDPQPGLRKTIRAF
jgi:hypothetical protein